MKLIELVGKKFGMLTVLSRAENDRWNKPMWLCLCDCGNTKVIRGKDLRAGTTKACGCRVGKNNKPRGVAAFNNCYCSYEIGARKRGLPFELSKEVFKVLTSQHCHYCGAKPAQVTKGYGYGDYVYNGLDRVDNSLGYFPDNVVPCCGLCNRAKSAMTVEEFLSWIRRVHKHSCEG